LHCTVATDALIGHFLIGAPVRQIGRNSSADFPGWQWLTTPGNWAMNEINSTICVSIAQQ
jgi:hypothetical protein